jgi:hypothetical protein
LPIKGQIERIDSANAALTCWIGSLAMAPKQGTIF